MLKLRILAASLALSLILPITYPVFADNEETIETVTTATETVKPEAISDEVKTPLSSLGILTEAEMATNDFVVRSFAAEVIVRMAGLDTSKPAAGTVYNDVDENTLYAYSIEQATAMGYFAGTGHGYFMPDGIITDKQMATVLMRFSGYDGKIPLENVYGRLGKGVNSADDLTYHDLAYMLYNFLDMGIINLENISKSGNSYTINGDKNILNDWFSVYVAEGIIQKTGKTALFSSSDIAKDEIALSTSSGMLKMKIGDTKVAKELGKYVKVYYKIEDMTNNLVCIGYVVSEGRNNIAEFSLNNFDIASSNATTLYYYDENGKQKKISYSPSAAVIYNESYYSDGIFSPSLLSNKEGTICAIDNDSNNTYDVIYIEAYEAHRVKNVVLSSNTINFKDGGSIVLDDDNFDDYSIVNENGIGAYLEDFTENTIVSVAESCSSATFRTAKVVVSADIVEGNVSAVDQNDAGCTVLTIDQGDTYRLIRGTFNETGKGVKLFITFLGNVVDTEIAGNVGFRYGLLAKFKYNKKDNTLYVKILNSSNQHEEYTVSEKLRIDGTTYKGDIDLMKTALEAPVANDVGTSSFSDIHCYPIRYKCREDGTLSEIDTPLYNTTAETLNTFRLIGAASVKRGYMLNYVLGFEIPVSSSTVFFAISASEEEYDATDGWGYKWTQETFNDTKYTNVLSASSAASTYNNRLIRYYAYKSNNDSDAADVVITLSGPGSAENTSKLFMYDKKFIAYDEERDEIVTKLVGYLGGVKTEIAVMPEYSTDSTVTTLQRGDVISYGTDTNGRLSRIHYLVKHNATDSSTLKLSNVNESKNTDTFSKARNGDSGGDRKLTAAMIYGYVLERQGDLIHFKDIIDSATFDGSGVNRTINRAAAAASTSADGWIRIPASTPVTVYDPSKTEPVYVGTYDEILDGTKMSVIGIRYGSNTTIQEIVVFNEDF